MEGASATPKRRRLSREERRAELLAAAIRVFSRRGIGGARHSEIAEEAGVSVPTTFVYFPTREDLVRDVLSEVAEVYVELVRSTLAREAPAPEVLLDLANSFAQSVRSHPDHARVWQNWSTAVRDEVWPLYLEFQRQIMDLIERAIERGQRQKTIAAGIDTTETARLCVAGGQMIAQLELMGSPRQTLDNFIRTLLRATGITSSSEP